MKLEIDSDTGLTIFGITLLILVLSIVSIVEYGQRQEDANMTKVQLALAEKGYSPVDISCAYNIGSPVCIARQAKGELVE